MVKALWEHCGVLNPLALRSICVPLAALDHEGSVSHFLSLAKNLGTYEKIHRQALTSEERARLHMIRIYILISQISFTSMVVLPLFFFFFSRIPQLQNTSSMSLIATVHLNIQIPQLVTLILNTSFLLLYLSIPHQIFIHHKYTSFFDSCVTVQYMSHNSRTKDHGTVSSRNKICVMVIFHLAALNSFRFVESTVNCLVNFAFYHQETKYSDESIVPK